jgi:hypothetical protein
MGKGYSTGYSQDAVKDAEEDESTALLARPPCVNPTSYIRRGPALLEI